MFLMINGRDVTNYVNTVSSGGSINGCARTLDAQLLQTPNDPNIETLGLSTGAEVQFSSNGYYFYGVLAKLDRPTEGNVLTIKAYDMGLYLKRNSVTQKISGASPSSAARTLCRRFGVRTGYLEETGTSFTRIFKNTTLYAAIMTGYTFASQKTGEKYQITFDGSLMCVVERGTIIAGTMRPGNNLMEATYSESIERVVNRVDMYDREGNLVDSVHGDTSIGIMAQALTLTEERGRDYAQKILRDNKLARSGSVEILGNPLCVTGNAVLVHEPYSGLYGKFYIDSDTHTWKNGLYICRLKLNFENMMDEQEAGSAIQKSSQKQAAVHHANSTERPEAAEPETPSKPHLVYTGPHGEIIYEDP